MSPGEPPAPIRRSRAMIGWPSCSLGAGWPALGISSASMANQIASHWNSGRRQKPLRGVEQMLLVVSPGIIALSCLDTIFDPHDFIYWLAYCAVYDIWLRLLKPIFEPVVRDVCFRFSTRRVSGWHWLPHRPDESWDSKRPVPVFKPLYSVLVCGIVLIAGPLLPLTAIYLHGHGNESATK